MNLLKPRFSIALSLLLVCVVSGLAAAADLPTDHPLTLKELVDFALANHNNVLAAEQNLSGAKAGVRQARAGYFPQISLNSDYTSSGLQTSRTGGVFERAGNGSGIQNTASITETFYNGGRTQAAVRQAAASAKGSEADLELARQNRVLLVTQAYFDALRTKKLSDIAAQSVAEAEDQLKLINARVQAGDAAPVDVYPVDVQLANARLTKLQADNNARVAANNLRNSVGLSKGPELKLVDVEQPSTETPKLDESLAYALEHRPEMASAKAQVDSAQAGLTLAKAQRIPVPTASLSYDRGLGGTGFDSQWTIGVGVSLNVFDGGAAAANVTSSKARVESAKLNADQVRKDVSTEVEQAYLNYTSASEQLTASQANVTLAAKNLEVARAKYQQGLAIPLEIVSAQVSYSDAQTNYAQALYGSYTARAQLDKAMGKRGY